MTNLPAPVEPHRRAVHPALLRAATSPTAVGAAAVGAGVGVLAQSVVVGVVLAAAGWCGRMGVAVVQRRRREAVARPHPAELDPWSVPEPWRQMVQQAASAQHRFEEAVEGWPPGPMRERVWSLRGDFFREFAAVGSLATRGATLSGWSGGIPDPTRAASAGLATDLERTRAERVGLGDRAPDRVADLARREHALAAQIRAIQLSERAARSLEDRLRVIVARLDEAVTHLVGLGIDAGDGGGLDQVAAVLNRLDDELGALTAGIEATRTTPDP
jgi:hypothetical protein